MQNVTVPDNFGVKWAISDGELRAVSDGSYKDSHGTAAWMIYISDKCVINGRCITPGNPQSQSAYQSELAGLYCIAFYIRFLEKTKKITGLTVGCDGQSALNRACRTWDFINPNEPQYDLIMAIRSMVATRTIRTDWKN
jgi:hypothetical protein